MRGGPRLVLPVTDPCALPRAGTLGPAEGPRAPGTLTPSLMVASELESAWCVCSEAPSLGADRECPTHHLTSVQPVSRPGRLAGFLQTLHPPFTPLSLQQSLPHTRPSAAQGDPQPPGTPPPLSSPSPSPRSPRTRRHGHGTPAFSKPACRLMGSTQRVVSHGSTARGQPLENGVRVTETDAG